MLSLGFFIWDLIGEFGIFEGGPLTERAGEGINFRSGAVIFYVVRLGFKGEEVGGVVIIVVAVFVVSCEAVHVEAEGILEGLAGCPLALTVLIVRGIGHGGEVAFWGAEDMLFIL